MVDPDDKLLERIEHEDHPVVEPLTEADEEELAEADREGRLAGVEATDALLVEEEEDEDALGPPAA